MRSDRVRKYQSELTQIIQTPLGTAGTARYDDARYCPM